jgi:isopentenyl-diphosphate delta-isomerase
MDKKEVILVDEKDKVIGSMEKMEAHLKGVMHRAFSVFIFNSSGQMLLQQRAIGKYHSAGLWSNACCSHPYPGEDIEMAAQRRLNEEMGFKTSLEKLFDFVYKASFGNDLIENEFDHVFVGKYEGEININPREVSDYSFKSVNAIKQELKEKPETYTAWFHIAFPKIESWWKKNFVNEK